MVVRVEGTADLQRVAAALKEAGDKDLQNKVSAALRNEAKPLGQRVVTAGAAVMPGRGGFRARVAGSKVGVTSALKGRVASVSVVLRNKGADLKSLDAGTLRHPVFKRAGRRAAWVRQGVPAGAFTRAFEAQAPEVQRAATKAAQDVLDDVARKA